ncbi:hypothetical protein [Aquimarina sp. 2201CG14-23]|uniref:hypothetical protein n=1 Tax=Aquimarina mycalae TaxID=3040073 RepID=UPI0024780DA2|nr:hypothetical protein [Aquimarina sp. 2201CG14-23]MDH7446569.1 hypothetical protein [Aquimarina sp. 2201CG14-23]
MIKKEYKVLGIKCIKFVGILLIADLVFGTVSKELFFSQETGKYARSSYAINEVETDILVFGSSHAHRHYIPEVFEKNLQNTAYNVGAEGQQLLYHTAMQKMILKRTTPALIILNIDGNFLYKSPAAYDRLSDLHPYYSDNKDELRPILGLQSKFIDFKLFFKAYQTNSTLIHAIRYYASPQLDYQGYRPLSGTMKPSEDNIYGKNEKGDDYIEEIDENFLNAFKEFIENAKKHQVKLAMVTSPSLNEVDYSQNASMIMMKEIAKEENIPFIDFYNSEPFKFNHLLFHDVTHLNNKGANMFTKRLTDTIKTKGLISDTN